MQKAFVALCEWVFFGCPGEVLISGRGQSRPHRRGVSEVGTQEAGSPETPGSCGNLEGAVRQGLQSGGMTGVSQLYPETWGKKTPIWVMCRARNLSLGSHLLFGL